MTSADELGIVRAVLAYSSMSLRLFAVPCLALVGGVSLSLGSTAQASSLVFFDTFNANTSGLNAVPTGWDVSNGTVDIIADFGSCPGAGPADAVPGGGCIIDLDGTTGDSGVLSKKVSLTAGEEYSLTYYLRGGGDDNKLSVLFGLATANHVIPSGSPWRRFVLPMTSSVSGDVIFSFENQGGDNMGIFLDNVGVFKGVVADVPTPLPLGAAVAVWGASRRLRQRLR